MCFSWKKFFHTDLRSTYPYFLQSKSWLTHTISQNGFHMQLTTMVSVSSALLFFVLTAPTVSSWCLGKLLLHGWTVYMRMVQASLYSYLVDIHVTFDTLYVYFIMIQHGCHQDIQTLSLKLLFLLEDSKKGCQEAAIFYTELFPMFSFLGVNPNEYLWAQATLTAARVK